MLLLNIDNFNLIYKTIHIVKNGFITIDSLLDKVCPDVPSVYRYS